MLLAGGHAADLVIEGDVRSLVGFVGVASATHAGEKAAAGSCGSGGGGGRGNDVRGCGGRGGEVGGAEGVACAATAGADVGGCGRGWLGEDVAGRHVCFFVLRGVNVGGDVVCKL